MQEGQRQGGGLFGCGHDDEVLCACDGGPLLDAVDQGVKGGGGRGLDFEEVCPFAAECVAFLDFVFGEGESGDLVPEGGMLAGQEDKGRDIESERTSKELAKEAAQPALFFKEAEALLELREGKPEIGGQLVEIGRHLVL